MEGVHRRKINFPAYVDRIPLARRRKPDSWTVIGIEAALIVFAVGLGTFTYYRAHVLPLYAAKTFAHLGSPAAANGDELAAYNLAVAYIKGEIQGAKTETIRALLTQAAKGGIQEAVGLLHTCGNGQCLKAQKNGPL
ncbi:unnamed protein product [Dibothriocephalus latus]|uniref:Uncharacterized protein n=1 Tax=Dibothriocephalus latus TaxID=60516 RepID=A0A3P7LC48_DIBLA|nr:unnamed protein product [Dibothriocephalus latus]